MVQDAAVPAHPHKQLLLYVAGVVATLALIEGGVRWKAHLFAAASHRTLTKLAVLEQQPEVQLLFVGSSRTQDGVSPRLVSEELASLDPKLAGVRGFNAASTATSLETLEWLTSEVAGRPGLRLAILEVSGPQLTHAQPQFLESPRPPADLEGRLADQIRRHLALVEHRGVLFSDNLTRLPALLIFGQSLDGSEVMAGEQLAAWRGHHEPLAGAFDESGWRLRSLDTTTVAAAAQVDELASVASQFTRQGVQVVFMVPPLARSYADAPERGAAMHELLRELHARTQAEVWDWSAAELPDALFRGSSHLNHPGRAQFARVLARQLARSGLLAGKG